jgi:hypothetical protein
LRELDAVAVSFTRLTERHRSDIKFLEILASLLPEPKKPRNVERRSL